MASTTPSNSGHVFVPRDDTITAAFASREKAGRAISAVSELGIPRDEVELISGSDHQAPPNSESPGREQNATGVDAFDEILGVFTESFSDDEKAYALFDRMMAAGGVLLSVPMTGREQARSDLAAFLRRNGARAVYYWGALATERL
jgi:hypothetical protein